MNETKALNSVRGLTGKKFSGTTVTLYATNAAGATSTLQTVTDTNGYNAAFGGT